VSAPRKRSLRTGILRALPAGLALAASAGGTLPARGQTLDEALYAELLVRHTREVPDLARTRVDYRGLTRSADWRRLLESLSRSDPARLERREQQLAFWINAYNILAVDTVVRSYPLASIRDAGTLLRPVWKREAGRIGGRAFSLDEIEHGQVRSAGDPRTHAAIVCASLSCPALRREPFRAAELDAQLDDAMRTWMADPGKGLRLDPASDRVWLSKIFDWFAEDFAAAGGPLRFAARYAPEPARQTLESEGDRLRVRYFDYDWRLNDLAGTPP
jgi:hypothetical protein